MDAKNLKDDEKGQAVFELIVFLPILIFLYTFIFNVGNSINVAINQQKVIRRYYYFLMKGNSYIPYQGELSSYSGVVRSGASMIGYADKLQGADGGGGGGSSVLPFAPCFRFNSLFSDSNEESCDDPKEGERESSYIRVHTVYGVCGENFSLQGNRWVTYYAEGPTQNDNRSSKDICTLASE